MERLVDHLRYVANASVEIVATEDCKKVVVTCSRYKNSTFTVPFGYSLTYPDLEILYSDEVENWLSKTLGYKQVTVWECK